MMGVYHFKLSLLPRSSLGATLPAVLSEHDVEKGEDWNTGWWILCPPSETLVSGLRSLFPRDTSWGDTEEYQSTGDWKSSLRIWKEGQKVWEIDFNYSPIADDWSVMQRFLDLARREGCVLLNCSTLEVMATEEEIVIMHFRKSRAARFLRDPKGTILEAANEVAQADD